MLPHIRNKPTWAYFDESVVLDEYRICREVAMDDWRLAWVQITATNQTKLTDDMYNVEIILKE